MDEPKGEFRDDDGLEEDDAIGIDWKAVVVDRI